MIDTHTQCEWSTLCSIIVKSNCCLSIHKTLVLCVSRKVPYNGWLRINVVLHELEFFSVILPTKADGLLMITTMLTTPENKKQ